MAVIYLDLPQVEDCVKQVESLIENLKTIAGEMDGIIVNRLPEHWKGESSNKTQQVYAEEYQPLLREKLPQAVESLSKFITDCKNSIAETDSKLSGQGQ